MRYFPLLFIAWNNSGRKKATRATDIWKTAGWAEPRFRLLPSFRCTSTLWPHTKGAGASHPPICSDTGGAAGPQQAPVLRRPPFVTAVVPIPMATSAFHEVPHPSCSFDFRWIFHSSEARRTGSGRWAGRSCGPSNHCIQYSTAALGSSREICGKSDQSRHLTSLPAC